MAHADNNIITRKLVVQPNECKFSGEINGFLISIP